MNNKHGTPILKAFALYSVIMLAACGDNGSNDQPTDTDPSEAPPVVVDTGYNTFILGLLPDTQGGSDAQGDAHVAMHPMDEILKQQLAAGVNMVIPVGDLTNKGSDTEWQEWTSVAQSYKEAGMEFLPVMGNHEASFTYTTAWIKNMRNYIPNDAVHMPGYEWLNYYVIRENVLVIGLAYENLPKSIKWIEEVVTANEDKVDHIVVASHDGLIGAKYGETRELIVEGVKDDNVLFDVQKEIREFFAEHDVIYVQGHEHQYQRSLIAADTTQTTMPSGSTPSGGNYRMSVYTQIMSGNASYKGYEFRYGERELVQTIISQKNATFDIDKGSDHYDVNSSWLTFDNDRVDYVSYYAAHTAINNYDEQDFDAQWHLMDQFTRTANRCETVIYPNSIAEGTRPVLIFQPEYLTDICLADDGSIAQLIGGVNNTFNRTDARTQEMEYIPGFTRAETMTDLMRLSYQWLFQYHQSWSPNLIAEQRVIPDTDENVLLVPEATFDLKEYITLNWSSATADTQSDILIISGTQNQTGVYQSDYGAVKDIETDSGLAVLDGKGNETAKPAVTLLPVAATKSWDISDAVADPYVVSFQAADSLGGDTVLLAQKTDNGWAALASAECVVAGAWLESYLTSAPSRDSSCDSQSLVGYDESNNSWWVVLKADAELALISR